MRSRHVGRSKRDRLGAVIATGLLAAVALTALAHGAVEPWSVMLFELVVLALIALWTIKVLRDRRLKLTIPQITLPVIALVIVGLLQSIASTGGGNERRSLSFDVESTRRTVIVLVFLLISFLIAANFLASRRRLKRLAGFMTLFGLLLAIFALAQHFTWNGKLYWLRENTVSISPFGPFVNHNHFAGYMELLIPVPIALIITRAVRRETRLLYGFAAAAMGIALVASLSRGGMISLAASLIFLILMSARLPRPAEESDTPIHGEGTMIGGQATALRGLDRIGVRASRILGSRILIVAMIAGAITAGLIWVGPEPVARRVAEPAAGDNAQRAHFSNRAWVWRDTLSMIRANPMLGVGLGAFGTAFSIYTQSDGSIGVPQAHNDYLQVVADCGVLGGLIALWFLVVTFRAIWRGVRSQDPLMAGLALGAGGGIFAILVHSLFDFNLQLPSTALLFLVLSAVVAHISAIAPEASQFRRQPVRQRPDGSSVASTQVVRGVST
jgi:O-antigen ligase